MLALMAALPWTWASARAAQCPGSVPLRGYGDVQVVPTGWDNVSVTDLRQVHCNMNGRAYFTDTCTAGFYAREQYLALKLLGKTMRYTIDLNQATCGCNAAFYLTSMHQNHDESTCGDYYCDANAVCGVRCAEIDIMEANTEAWHSTLHAAEDNNGLGGGIGGGGSGWNGPRDWQLSDYGPGARCIDTNRPFEVAVSFPVDHTGMLKSMDVQLSQTGSSCPLTLSVGGYMGMPEVTQALADGMTPILSYWSNNNMRWLDGEGADHQGPCHRDSAAKCSDHVMLYDFSVEDIEGQSLPEILPADGLPDAAAPAAQPAPAPAPGPQEPPCDCSWIPDDDCKSNDFCAKACRKTHPDGPCGAIAKAHHASPALSPEEAEEEPEPAPAPYEDDASSWFLPGFNMPTEAPTTTTTEEEEEVVIWTLPPLATLAPLPPVPTPLPMLPPQMLAPWPSSPDTQSEEETTEEPKTTTTEAQEESVEEKERMAILKTMSKLMAELATVPTVVKVNDQCHAYLASTGCSWTQDHSCPGQPEGWSGVAGDDGSTGFKCCCKYEMWKEDVEALRVATASNKSMTQDMPQLCSASHGGEVGGPVCCGQSGHVRKRAHICPASAPTCIGYIHEKRWGTCQVAEPWQQCGGMNKKDGTIWWGPTTCTQGFKCEKFDEDFSHCIKDSKEHFVIMKSALSPALRLLSAEGRPSVWPVAALTAAVAFTMASAATVLRRGMPFRQHLRYDGLLGHDGVNTLIEVESGEV